MTFKLSEHSVEELKDYLLQRGVCEEAATNFQRNRVSGLAFLKLTEDDLKELVPLIGVRTEIRDILKEHRKAQDNGSRCDDDVVSPSLTPINSKAQDNGSRFKDVEVRPILTPISSQGIRWHQTFEIPEKPVFSGSVQKAIDTGVISSKARQEIIQMLRTLMVQHTRFPTSEEYTTISQKLVIKYPKLRDSIGSNGYGSWKQSLRNSFKNFRRDHFFDENNQSTKRQSAASSQPPSKRHKAPLDECETLSEDDYEEALAELQTEWKKGKKGGRNHSVIKQLMEKTASTRHRWITDERPLVSQVLEKYPLLKESRMLRREFCAIVGLIEIKSLKEEWAEWMKKLITFARVEALTRPAICKLLEKIKRVDGSLDNEDDYKDFVAVELLTKLLYPRGPPKGARFLKHFETCDIDLDQEVEEINQSEPYIIVTGRPGEETSQYFISAENAITTESKTFRDALVDVISTYYVFDITYPKSVCGLFLFFQQSVFGVKDSQHPPSCLSKLVQNIQAI